MIKPIKELGQNFLRNQKAVTEIVNLLEIKDLDFIIEIGPGEGVLTFEVLKNPKNFTITSIDVDGRVAEILSKIQDSRFKFKLSNILKESEIFNQTDYKVLGAIPYNITSPIFHLLVEQKTLPSKVVLVIQKEVAEKITDSKKESYLSNYLKYFFDLKYEFTISREDFYPAPKVDSAVVTFTKKQNITEIDKKKFSNFLHKVFRSPRKKINKVFTKEILNKCEIDENLRPENLTQKELIRLFELE
jgi:16S rRNA (adenine1518-N6/adenine1519-N6)-dimethyltransferase